MVARRVAGGAAVQVPQGARMAREQREQERSRDAGSHWVVCNCATRHNKYGHAFY
jgi:hypothetical protein